MDDELELSTNLYCTDKGLRGGIRLWISLLEASEIDPDAVLVAVEGEASFYDNVFLVVGSLR